MILACVIFYNDEIELIENCFKSLKGKVDRILAVDGAYKEFPHDKPYSTNGALEIAKQYADCVIETKEAWHDQATKRNQYLIHENENDYYFIIDADEVLSGNIPKDLKEDVYKLFIEKPTANGTLPGEYCRLIRHQSGIAYQKKHNLLMAKGMILSYPTSFMPCLDKNIVKIIHYSDKRSVKRNEKDGEYLRNREENRYHYDFAKLDKVSHQAAPINLNSKRAIVKFIGHREYNGFDFDSNPVYAITGKEVDVSIRKANQLLTDFPNNWKLVKKDISEVTKEILQEVK